MFMAQDFGSQFKCIHFELVRHTAVQGSRFRVQGVASPLNVALEGGQLSSLCVVNRQFQVTPLETVDARVQCS
jgi:hypothetical protein